VRYAAHLPQTARRQRLQISFYRSPGVKLSVVSSFPSWMMETEDNVIHEEKTAYERV
jgi:hypothetical protein